MELSEDLKNLYKHWSLHTGSISKPIRPEEIFTDPKLFKDISWFINERLNIWKKKISNSPSPYTQDPILSEYRFCNIFREFDRQTIEFHILLNPLRGNFSLWLLNMFYCRMIAHTETVKSIGFLSYNEAENKLFYERFMNSPRPRFGTPYVFPISTILKSSTPTRESFIAHYLPGVIGAIAEKITSWEKKNVYDGVEEILPIFGFNLHFLWTEVLIDVAYQYPEYIDLFGRFPVGPGSKPTMGKINKDNDPSLLAQELSSMHLNTGITFNNIPLRLSAENWEGIACEFRKYTNLKAGKGRKRKYTPV